MADNFELDMMIADGYVVSSEYDFDTSKTSEYDAGNFRKPIIMETYLTKASLVEAIRRGESMGSKYGEVMICKIVAIGTLSHVKGIIARGRMSMMEDGNTNDDHIESDDVTSLLDGDVGDSPEIQVQISSAAINYASLHLIDIWYNLRETESHGLFDWLASETREAVEMQEGKLMRGVMTVAHNGMIFSVRAVPKSSIFLLKVSVLE